MNDNSGASSSGAEPAVSNANQFLSAYLNMVGSALPAGTVPALSPAAAALTATSPSVNSPTTHAAPAASSSVPTLAVNPTVTMPPLHHHHRGDPLFVLDMNRARPSPPTSP